MILVKTFNTFSISFLLEIKSENLQNTVLDKKMTLFAMKMFIF